MMKKLRHTFVVRCITSRTLLITQRNFSRADQPAIVAPESSQMKRMNQASHWRIFLLLEGRSRTGNLACPPAACFCLAIFGDQHRSEERRVGKEGRARGGREQ